MKNPVAMKKIHFVVAGCALAFAVFSAGMAIGQEKAAAGETEQQSAFRMKFRIDLLRSASPELKQKDSERDTARREILNDYKRAAEEPSLSRVLTQEVLLSYYSGNMRTADAELDLQSLQVAQNARLIELVEQQTANRPSK